MNWNYLLEFFAFKVKIFYFNILEILFIELILLKSLTKYNIFSIFYFGFAIFLWVKHFNRLTKLRFISNFVMYVLLL